MACTRTFVIQISERGHIQNIQLASGNYFIHIWAEHLPQMRMDWKCKLSLVLEKQSNDITEAECECLAGRAPTQSCKLIAALCYTLDSFCKHRQLPQLRTRMEWLLTWRPWRVKLVPLQQLKFQQNGGGLGTRLHWWYIWTSGHSGKQVSILVEICTAGIHVEMTSSFAIWMEKMC